MMMTEEVDDEDRTQVFRLHRLQPVRHAYIGMTNSIYRRTLEHKRVEIEGFASKYHCDRMVYYESFDDVQKAIAREKQLKGWRRSKKIALIESTNPRWVDLAEKWGAQMLFAGESMNGR
jgi:putative endonuclease